LDFLRRRREKKKKKRKRRRKFFQTLALKKGGLGLPRNEMIGGRKKKNPIKMKIARFLCNSPCSRFPHKVTGKTFQEELLSAGACLMLVFMSMWLLVHVEKMDIFVSFF
jgi:hypothetical protein